MKKTFLAFSLAVILLQAGSSSAQSTTITVTTPQQPQVNIVTPQTAPPVTGLAVPPAAPTAAPALPSWTRPGPYAMVQLGAYGPTDDEKNYDVYNPQTGYTGIVALGYRFSPYISTQVEFGYQNSEGEFGDWEFSGMPVVAVARLGIPISNFEIYGLAGIGGLFYNVDEINDSHDEVAIMSKLGGGVAFHFGQWFVGGEVSYQMTDISYAPNDAMIGTVTIGFTFE